MRSQPGFRISILCALLCALLLLAPLAQAAGRTIDRTNDDSPRVRTAETVSTSAADRGPVNLHRLLREYLRLRVDRLFQAAPTAGAGFGMNGLSDDPDPTSDNSDNEESDDSDDSAISSGPIWASLPIGIDEDNAGDE